MRILVHHQGQQLGPFTVEQVRAALAAGTISTQDLAWCEGAPAWVPVATLPGLSVALPPPAGVPPVAAAAGDGSGLALWSMILGILSLFMCGFLSGIPAVICGHMALARKSRAGVTDGKGIAITGLVTGYAGTVLTTAVAIAIVAAVAIPAYSTVKSQAGKVSSMNNARSIALALEIYEAEHGGVYPETLREMVGKELPDQSKLTDPLAPEFGSDGFIYVRPDKNDPPDKVILMSRGQLMGGRRIVAHKDASVDDEVISLPADL